MLLKENRKSSFTLQFTSPWLTCVWLADWQTLTTHKELFGPMGIWYWWPIHSEFNTKLRRMESKSTLLTEQHILKSNQFLWHFNEWWSPWKPPPWWPPALWWWLRWSVWWPWWPPATPYWIIPAVRPAETWRRIGWGQRSHHYYLLLAIGQIFVSKIVQKVLAGSSHN